MSTTTANSFGGSALPVCLWQRNPNRLVSLWDVIQIYAHRIVALLDELTGIQKYIETASRLPPLSISSADLEKRMAPLVQITGYCHALQLSSAIRQIAYIQKQKDRLDALKPEDYIQMLAELRRRIREDLEGCIFFCIYDSAKATQFFKYVEVDLHEGPVLKFKAAHELFDSAVAERFPQAIDDINEAGMCFAMGRYTASVFHLMRILEVGVRELARLVDHKDFKPGWGKILQTVERYVLRTKYEELPALIQPHIEFLRQVLPRMQSVQIAWRNKISHVGQQLIPNEASITEQVAGEIFAATQGLSRYLAVELPSGLETS